MRLGRDAARRNCSLGARELSRGEPALFTGAAWLEAGGPNFYALQLSVSLILRQAPLAFMIESDDVLRNDVLGRDLASRNYSGSHQIIEP